MSLIRNKRPNSNSDVPDDKKFREMDTEYQPKTGKKIEGKEKESEVPEDKLILKALLEKMKLLDCLPDMQSNLVQIKENLSEFKASLEFTQGEINTMKEQHEQQEAKISDLEKRVNQLEALRTENQELRKQIISLEAYGRRENLIFENNIEQQGENCTNVLRSLFKKQLHLKDADTIMIQRAHRLGLKNVKSNRSRPIIVRFAFFPDRELVWQNRRLLAGTQISMREDFPEPVEQERRTLIPIFKAARKMTDVKAKLVANKLIINSQAFTTDTLDHLPAPLAPRKVCERIVKSEKGETYHLFEGKLSPFSNLYPSPFTLDNVNFCCGEQYYSYQKAIFAKQPDVAQLILNEQDPIKIKRLDRKFLNVNHKIWVSERGKAAMAEAIEAKFTQNLQLRDILLATQGSTLVECNRYDPVWGIGLSLDSRDAADCTSWKGQNLLGILLCQVRVKLAA